MADIRKDQQLALPVGSEADERIAVEPAVLKWARESLGLTPERAASRIGISPNTLAKWESGEASPTLPQLRRAAAKYKRPLAVLLLPRPAKDYQALRDFRRSGEHEGHPSPELTAESWRAQTQRDVLLELDDLGSTELPTSEPPSISPQTPAEPAGALLRGWVGIERTRWSRSGDALDAWIGASEVLGTVVVQTHRVAVDEMRGFSVADWPRPIIALNGSDSQRGRLFTLAHELVHLCLRNGGLCDLHEERSNATEEDRIERFCNAVAAAALMPRDVVMDNAAVAQAAQTRRWTLEELDALARPFGTSAEAMLLRLVTLDRATWDLYRERKAEFRTAYEEAREQQRASKSGPSYYVVKARDLGPGYVRTVLEAFRGRSISALDAADYLDVRYEQIPQLEAAAR